MRLRMLVGSEDDGARYVAEGAECAGYLLPREHADGLSPGRESCLPHVPGVRGKAGCVRERHRRDIRSESADDHACKPELALFRVFQILRGLVYLCLGFIA